jgi:hypothetical protein
MRPHLSDLYWLTDEQMAQLEPYVPKSHGKPQVDDRRVLSGIVFVNRNGLRWRDAPREYGLHKTLYNRWKRWGEKGAFLHIRGRTGGLERHTEDDHDRRDLSEGAPHGVQFAGKKGAPRHLIGRTKGGMNTKLHAVTVA